MKFSIERATLGTDPEYDVTANGNTVAKLNVAVNHNRKVNNEWETETDWFNLVCYGNTADKVMKMELSKGDSIVITDGSVRVSVVGEGDARKWYTNYIVSRFGKLERYNNE